jgi:asparagine synthase (glutamine-hydrolysing)
MCGVAGLIERRLRSDKSALHAKAEAMANALAHRGPDGSGTWCDVESGAALSHRRLAIIDPTPSGAQPMISADERWVISYNGEVYNTASIARELVGVSFRGTCDTEVILESVARLGLKKTISRLNGMFSILLWDRKERTMHLIRDRIGIKPLYYGLIGDAFLVASELKSIVAVARPHLEIDRASVASFLRFGHVPAPWSIFKHVSKVMPGEIVSVGLDGKIERTRYWSLTECARDGLADPFKGDDADAEQALHDLLADAVSGQMISDVPLGALLSGGIDSSTVVALMVAANRGPVRTYSIGFPELSFDESDHALAVARHLGSEHTELTISGADALAVVPNLANIYDEPFGDSSQIPTFLVSKLARNHVTVALSGDGGDELFAGYDRYQRAEGLATKMSYLPFAVRRGLASLLAAMPHRAASYATLFDRSGMLPARITEKTIFMSEVLAGDRDDLYLRLVSHCSDPEAFIDAREHPTKPDVFPPCAEGLSHTERMQLLDMATYLPDDILQKVDRASMAVSLEVRPPLLDHRLIEFALRLPRRFHFREGQTKWLLRRVAYRYVPWQLLDRPKMGFVVPVAEWLRGPLRDWVEDLFDPARFAGGLLDVDLIRRLWTAHLERRRNVEHLLWHFIMFEAWRRRWMEGSVRLENPQHNVA